MARLKTSPFIFGSRYLVRDRVGFSTVYEAEALEHSPSLEFIKLRYANGHEAWRPVKEIDVVEKLLNTRAKKRRKSK